MRFVYKPPNYIWTTHRWFWRTVSLTGTLHKCWYSNKRSDTVRYFQTTIRFGTTRELALHSEHLCITKFLIVTSCLHARGYIDMPIGTWCLWMGVGGISYLWWMIFLASVVHVHIFHYGGLIHGGWFIRHVGIGYNSSAAPQVLCPSCCHSYFALEQVVNIYYTFALLFYPILAIRQCIK